MAESEPSLPHSLPPGRTQYIPIAKIVIPPDARLHTEERIRAMAEDLRANDLIQEITVAPNGDDTFELVAGCRRLRGATLAGWEQIRCSVRDGLSALDKLRLMFLENQDRDDASPFYQAALIEQMLAQSAIQQKSVAAALGMDETNVGRYRAFAKIPEDLKLELTRVNFSFSQLRELIRIENPEQFREVAKKAVAQGMSSRALAQLVSARLKAAKLSKKGSGSSRPSRDPFAERWNAASGKGAWKVAYKGKNKWAFYVAASSADSWNDLGQWFGGMRESLWGKGGFEGGGTPRPEVQDPPQADVTAAVLTPNRPAVPVPVITEATYVQGNKLRLKWVSLGEGFRYQVFRSVGDTDPKALRFKPMDSGVVATAGAIINLYAGIDTCRFVAVSALDPQGHESELSKPIQFDLKSWNEENTVNPLASA